MAYIGSKPLANPKRANVPSSKHDEHAPGLPIRTWENVGTPEVPTKTERTTQDTQGLGSNPGRSSTTIHSHNRGADHGANLVSNFRPVHLNGIDGTFDDSDQVFNSIDLFWDTGAHSSIAVEEMLPAEFCQYLKQPLHGHTEVTGSESRWTPTYLFRKAYYELIASAWWLLALWSPTGEWA